MAHWQTFATAGGRKKPMSDPKKRKVRVELRKNRGKKRRETGWTRAYREHGFAEDESGVASERVAAKGELSRRRTIVTDAVPEAADETGLPMPAADLSACLPGRVLRVQGLYSTVRLANGDELRCVVRRLLRSLAIDERHVVAVGDRVWVRPASQGEGVIERVEPRHGLLTRASRGREHVIVANVDQVVVVASLAQPALKPHLIDRYLVSAEHGGLKAIVCLNKADLVNLADYQWLIGLYQQLGIPAFAASVRSGLGIDRLREHLRDKQTVFSGQSGVGKTSLLNAVQPGLELLVREVSEATQKGRHTTTTAELVPLEFGGWVVDTPGIRQFALWDIAPEELDGAFVEMRAFVPRCRFPGCSHMHEADCAVRLAVHWRQIAMQRYETFVELRTDMATPPER